MGYTSPIRKFVNPEIVYGSGALGLVGQYARTYEARRVLVVSDPGVIAAGWTGRVIASLDKAGIESVLFSSVSSNPRDSEVMSGAELYHNSGCDAIIVVGGGSPMDCAKGIGIVSTNQCHILECEGVDQVAHPMPPLICIPTTAGSSADVSQFAIITNSAEQVKIAIISKSTVPDVALIDPETTTTMDAYLTACTGMDALVHAIEAYVSNASSPLTDLHALQAVRLISSNLLTAIAEPYNLAARDAMMLASLEAGLAFSNASLGAVHAMSHSLGGFFDLPHGECNALLLDHVVAYNFQAAVERYRDIAVAMDIAASGLTPEQCLAALTGAIHNLRTQAGITTSLRAVGVTAANIPALARKAMKDACMVTNPRRPTAADIEAIYEQAL
ncbi:MAG: alcohol dehydrogenase [Desulfuromonadales bacterium GWD2_54_10]|nr:MAG: alcohol dehydrogenase [Desulfuromonadales bacterium GWD2_54_10]